MRFKNLSNRLKLASFFVLLSMMPYSVFSQCLQLNIQVESQPFCPNSFNGGQLSVAVVGGSGEYTYEWVNASGSFLPGGPQTNAMTYSFLPVNLECWVYVTDVIQNCVDSASYTFTEYACQFDTTNLQIYTPFDINPVGYNTYSECEIQLENQGCQVQFKPEFIISHPTESIQQNDFLVEYYNSQSVWKNINYVINSDGHAVGYWGSESGETLNCDEMRIRPVRVKFNQFNPSAPQGDYLAILRIWSVDENGNLLEIISEEEQISLTLLDTVCNDVSVVPTLTDATCPDQSNGSIELVGTGGLEPYQFSFNNSAFSSISNFSNLSYGMYYFSVQDALGCQNSDSVFLHPNPVLPDSVWFSNIGSFQSTINWESNPLVDGYRFRYKKAGQAWSSAQIAGSGEYDDGVAEMNTSKTLTNLSSLTNYDLQVKTNSLTDCQEGWSSQVYSFTTTMEMYSDEVKHTCQGVSTGHILFDIQSENNYVFDWSGPNGFVSSESSIYNLSQGNYTLNVLYNSEVIFDTTFSIFVSNSSIALTLNGESNTFNDVSYSYENPLQLCDTSNYLEAQSDFSNYVWSNGQLGSLTTIHLTDTLLFVQATDTNNCPAFSDTIFTTVNSNYVNFTQANQNEEYIKSHYNWCSNDSSIILDISSLLSGNYDLQWQQLIELDTITLSEWPSLEFSPSESSSYILDLSSCTFDFNVSFFNAPNLEFETNSPSCYGETNASIVLFADSMTPTAHFTLFDYTNSTVFDSISTLQSATIEGLAVGQYIATLENDWACSTQEIIDIFQPEPLSIDSFHISDVLCYGDSTAQISYNLIGGTAPYNYVINSDSLLLNGTLSSGNFHIEFTDVNQCIVDTNFTILEPSILSLEVIDSLLINNNCFGDQDGQISVVASGGFSPYHYEINGLSQFSPLFTGLSAGNYSIIVEDSVGCSSSISVEISQPSQDLFIDSYELSDTLGYCAPCSGDSTGSISINLLGGSMPYTIFMLDSQTPYMSSNITDLIGDSTYQFYGVDSQGCHSDTISVLCNSPNPISLSFDQLSVPSCCYTCDVSLNMSVFGGVQPFQYQLNNSEAQSDGGFDQLCGDSVYYATVTDNIGCSRSDSIFINNINCFEIDSFDVSDLLCYGDSTAQISYNLIGGTAPYNYVINSDSLLLNGTLSSGNFHIEFTDVNQCIVDTNFTILEPSILSLEVIDSLLINNNCFGDQDGQISVVASGGFSPYHYEINGLSQFSPLFTGLSAGNYSIIVEDSVGCSSSISVEISQPSQDLFIDSYELSDTLGYCAPCSGDSTGSISINLLGGSMPYTIFMLDSQTPYMSSNITDLIGDSTYQFYGVDSQGCHSDTISVLCNSPNPISLSFDQLSVPSCCYTCDVSLNMSVFGGVQPFQYQLNNSEAQSDGGFDQLCGDSVYYATVTDNIGCSRSDSIFINNINCLTVDTINFIDNQQPAIFTDSCGETGTAKIFVEASQGLGNYFISMGGVPQSFQTSAHVFENLSAGTFSIYVQDEQNCIDSIEVVVPEIIPITTELLLDTMYCLAPYINNLTNQSDQGTILAQSYQGTNTNFQYSIDQLDSSNYISSGLFDTLENTFYTLNVKDNDDCVYEYDIELPYLSIEFDYSIGNVSCPGNNDGYIQINTLESQTYSWVSINDSIISTNSIENLQAGLYEMTSNYSFEDTIGFCYLTQNLTISENETLHFNYSTNSVSCFESCDASITIDSVFGGQSPYTIVNMNTADTNVVFDQLCAGQYAVKMIDSVGCIFIQDIIIPVGNIIYPIIDFQNDTLVVLEPTIDNPVVGTPPYFYQWSLNDSIVQANSDDTFSPQVDGLYNVTVTDSLDCKGQSSYFDINGLGLDDLNMGYKISPNPFQNELFISSSSSFPVYWQLMDMKGRVLISGRFFRAFTLNTPNLSQGLYLLSLNNSKESVVYKILKH